VSLAHWPLCEVGSEVGSDTELGINAFICMTVARLVYFIVPEKKVWGVEATWLTRLFVGFDFVFFLIQAVGGSMASSPDYKEGVRIGQKIYMAGIGVQLGFVIIFGLWTGRFYKEASRSHQPTHVVRRAKILTWVLEAALILIMVS
jgi:hypothetical protein